LPRSADAYAAVGRRRNRSARLYGLDPGQDLTRVYLDVLHLRTAPRHADQWRPSSGEPIWIPSLPRCLTRLGRGPWVAISSNFSEYGRVWPAACINVEVGRVTRERAGCREEALPTRRSGRGGMADLIGSEGDCSWPEHADPRLATQRSDPESWSSGGPLLLGSGLSAVRWHGQAAVVRPGPWTQRRLHV